MSTKKTTEQILQELREFQNKPLSKETLSGWNILCQMAEEVQQLQKEEDDLLNRMEVETYHERETWGGADDYLEQYERECGTNFSQPKELVISCVHQVPAPYQKMYVLDRPYRFSDGFTIYGVGNVADIYSEYFLIANPLKNFVDAFDTFSEAEKLVIELQEAANETEIKVNVQPSTLTQDELKQLGRLLTQARTLLNSSESNVFVCLDEELGELVLFGKCNQEGVYRTISSQGISNDWM
jgi:hypothetical protein